VTKIVRSLVLVAVMAGLTVAGGWTDAPAQDKKADPKAQPIGKIEVWMAKDGWRWKVVDPDDKTIAMCTTGFDKKEECLKSLEMVKNTLNKAKVEVKDDKK
jgi:hypothetical protein